MIELIIAFALGFTCGIGFWIILMVQFANELWKTIIQPILDKHMTNYIWRDRPATD